MELLNDAVKLGERALSLLSLVPATFWGVVFGAFFSILSVHLTNRASTTRLEQQFDHERMLKTKEREIALKKDIYLEAAEAVSVALSAIVNISNLEIADDKVMEEYVKKSPVFAKAQVVGGHKTINAILEFTGEFGAQSLRLFAFRHQLMAEKAKATLLGEQAAQFRKEADRFLELKKQFNLDLMVDDKKWGVLDSSFEFEHQRSIAANQERRELVRQLEIKRHEFLTKCAQASLTLSPMVIPMLEAVREELELPLPSAEYRVSVEKSIANQRARVDEYLGNVSAELSKPPMEQKAPSLS